MQKIFVFFIIFTASVFAAYNPFFNDKTPPKQKIQELKPLVKEPIPKRQNVKMTYYGFIESTKGKFALINFNDHNIVIQKNDSLYIDEQIFKVFKITSNYILFRDKYKRAQTVYFSSEVKREQQ